jgi:hypothetical protein
MKKNSIISLCVLTVITVGICAFTSTRMYADGDPASVVSDLNSAICLKNPEYGALYLYICCEYVRNLQVPMEKCEYDVCFWL